jgi:hypothetical protein
MWMHPEGMEDARQSVQAALRQGHRGGRRRGRGGGGGAGARICGGGRMCGLAGP